MKVKKVFVLSLAFVALALTSCKKDYVCDCHIDDVDGNHIDQELDINGAKKGDAEKVCDDFEHQLEDNEMYEEADCQLM